MSTLPGRATSRIPPRGVQSTSSVTLTTADPFSMYDIAIAGIGFHYANSVDNPMRRVTIQPAQSQDQPRGATETTTTDWLIRGQSSFHAGAGQLQYEPDAPGPFTPVRYDCSKNVDPFVPGYVTRLPDATQVGTVTTATSMVGLVVSGADALAIVNGTGGCRLITTLAGTPTVTTLAGLTGATSITTDGTYVYAAGATSVVRWDPTVPGTATTIVSWTTPATDALVGWVKSRLLLAYAGSVYEVTDLTGATPATAATLRYTNPAQSFSWKCFGDGPQAVLASGYAPGGESVITSFTLDNTAGAPVLKAAGDIGKVPVGEHILALLLVSGSLLAVGTDKGVRVGTYDAFYGRLTIGPLHLTSADPVIPAYALTSRDNRIYAAGRDYDEAGLLCVNLGQQVDQAGRWAWAPNLITGQFTQVDATTVTMLPLSQRLVFGVPGFGLWMEGASAGSGREAWVRTSRVRFSTTEPKLFKLGRVRGYFPSGTVQVQVSTPDDPIETVASVGFVSSDPGEFKLPSARTEWMQLKMLLTGAPTVLYSWSVKARSGERKQRRYRLVLSLYDRETTKSGQQVTNELSSRARLAAVEELDASGDQVLLQEFTPSGVVSTVVQIEEVDFSQVARPTGTSDIGGTVAVTVRTVES